MSDTSDADDEAESPHPRLMTPRAATRSATPHPRRHSGHVGAASPDDPTEKLRQLPQGLQQKLTKQEHDFTRATERATKHHELQMKATEDQVKMAKLDAHEAKTRYQRNERQQRREHEDTERRLAHELRQAELHHSKQGIQTAKLLQ